jgi:hypothetical protein
MKFDRADAVFASCVFALVVYAAVLVLLAATMMNG